VFRARRRDFITFVGGALAFPLASLSQARASHRVIAILSGTSREFLSSHLKAFASQMETLGHVEGVDYDVVVRFAGGDLSRLTSLAAEAVRLKPDVIVAANTTAAVAAKGATTTIPIVSVALIGPVQKGLVADYAHPGGNLTGILISLDTLLGKQLQIATEMRPGFRKAGVLINPNSASSAVQRQDVEKVAADLNVQLVLVEVAKKEEIDPALQRFSSDKVETAIIPTDPMFVNERKHIATVLAELRLPAVYGLRQHAEVGGLISYGIDLHANWRHTADFVDRILRGSTPSELPVELPTKLELVINLKTAQALGLDVPPRLVARADEVIE
jgi:putative tryptophan/tyrosine transport system substrate-binding protein